jgi:hypothetical protein
MHTEKEGRLEWIQKFEKEQQVCTKINQELLEVKSQLKDATLSTKNEEIKNKTLNH